MRDISIDPKKKPEEPAEEQQLEKYNSVNENSKKTAQLIEDEKLNDQEDEIDRDGEKNDNSSLEKNVTGSEEIFEDKDENKVTNRGDDIVNKKGQ